MFKKILVATDFSQHSYYALQRAVAFAESVRAQLTCLHVISLGWGNPVKLLSGSDESFEIQRRIQEAEATYMEELKKLNTLYPIKFVVHTGRIPDQILKYAADCSIDFIFMGAHGTYYLNDYILGTNSLSVVKQTKIPIQLIKKPPASSYQRILVTTDFSEASKKAAEFAYKAYPQAEFLMLHVADVWYGKLLDNTNHRQKLQHEMITAMEEKLHHFLQKCAVDHSHFTTKFIGGYPADDIARYASLWDAQLVTAGTRSHPLLHYILIGRAVERLLRVNPTDTLILPP